MLDFDLLKLIDIGKILVKLLKSRKENQSEVMFIFSH